MDSQHATPPPPLSRVIKCQVKAQSKNTICVMLLGNSIAPVIRIQSTIFYVTEVGLDPIVGTHITIDGVMGQLYALYIQTACGQSNISEMEWIFVISARVCLIGNHEQEDFAGQLADKRILFRPWQHRYSKRNFSLPRGWWDRGLPWGGPHPFQTQLFIRGQFNPVCLQSGRFYGNFERQLIGHERHHEKFLPGPSQYEPTFLIMSLIFHC